MQPQNLTAASEAKPNSGLDSALVGGVQQAQMKPKTLVIYGAESKLSDEHQEVKTPSGDSFFVRIEESNEGELPALNNAKCQPWESLLNTLDVGISEPSEVQS